MRHQYMAHPSWNSRVAWRRNRIWGFGSPGATANRRSGRQDTFFWFNNRASNQCWQKRMQIKN